LYSFKRKMISIAKKSSKAGNEKFVAVSEEIQG
jgi:hypothetical protein